jgi:hypothetical protein
MNAMTRQNAANAKEARGIAEATKTPPKTASTAWAVFPPPWT